MIVISKFSSLYFGGRVEWTAPHDIETCYIQKYAVDEEIRVQFTGTEDGYTVNYASDSNNITGVSVNRIYDAGNGSALFEFSFSISETGIYEITITGVADTATSLFCISEEEDLRDTILLNYTHRRNEYDTVFSDEENGRRRFNFRVEGGIYPGDKSQALNNEVFRDQRFEPHQISAESYEVSVLTIGTRRGVPQWVGNRINNIFKLSDVYVDRMETRRNESSVPEIIQLGTYYPLYVFKLNVEQSDEEGTSQSGEGGGGGDIPDNLLITRSGEPIMANDGTYLQTAG